MEEELTLKSPDLQVLRDAYAADPSNVGAGLQLAQQYADLGWYNQSLDLYRVLAKANPQNYSLMLDYGNVCYKHGDREEAIRAFTGLTELRPNRVEGWNNLGIVLMVANVQESARDAFEHVLALEPQNPGALINLAAYHYSSGSVEKSIELLRTAVATRPDFTDAWFNLGNAYVVRREYDQAIEAFKKALRYQPDLASAHKNLGFVYEQMGDFDQAEANYRKAQELKKSDAGCYINLANVCLRQGKTDEAKKNFLHAVRLSPKEISGWMGLRHLALLRGDVATYVRSTLAIVHRLSPAIIAESIAVLRELKHFDKVDEILNVVDGSDKQEISLDCERLLAYQRRATDRGKAEALAIKLQALPDPDDKVRRTLAEYYYNQEAFDKALLWIDKIREQTISSNKILWDCLIRRAKQQCRGLSLCRLQ